MGRYDGISDRRLRYEIQRFARILQRMEEKGETLDRTADIMTLLGELRRMVFAWEVRATHGEDGDQDPDPAAGDPEPPAPGGSSDPGGGGRRSTPADDPRGASEDESEESAAERIVRESREQERRFLEGLDPDE